MGERNGTRSEADVPPGGTAPPHRLPVRRTPGDSDVRYALREHLRELTASPVADRAAAALALLG
ncbi:hypothetical protein Kpho01_07860 [Kitasatospora phosalacinea]|uniref:Uncharacterized protein n=1 Tax=Kitasatospora phosalacinea TaxID=2065 RepID=A0A9W6PBK2_9ACTN|nr:hypothetical protein Kpho01_07860 [Kitasatospora phosalacinea]